MTAARPRKDTIMEKVLFALAILGTPLYILLQKLGLFKEEHGWGVGSGIIYPILCGTVTVVALMGLVLAGIFLRR